MEYLIPVALFLVGLLAIVKGADWLTDGSAAIARKFGISTLVVGLTVVAFGSSTPELVVSIVSAVSGNVDIALGNVVGSNIFNNLAIMGITAMVCPIVVERANIRYDVPFAVLASFAVLITAFDSFFDGGDVQNNVISRSDGLMLLCIFGIFMTYILAIAKNGKSAPQQATTSDTSVADDDKPLPSTLKSVALIVVGLAALIIGGNWLVKGASELAVMMGVSQSIVALTIVSAGTSSPELAASVMAARKGDTDMALGNVVGSNIFNVFLILGVSATVQPLGIGGITQFDIITLLLSSVMLWILCKFGKTYYTLTRMEGALLTLMAVAYYVVLCVK